MHVWVVFQEQVNNMVYVDVVFKSKLTGKWLIETKEFKDRKKALAFMYAMQNKGNIIDGWRCDDPYDNEWLGYRFKL